MNLGRNRRTFQLVLIHYNLFAFQQFSHSHFITELDSPKFLISQAFFAGRYPLKRNQSNQFEASEAGNGCTLEN